ncbi:MAG: hypothetical protein IPN15_22245 [Saprospiraceae bacterium]|nr:hypothetical protein [Candidatus Vicinibacter affinis]MBK8644837.1 hypothetical protein [Candidatus Vicinibacter affinis]
MDETRNKDIRKGYFYVGGAYGWDCWSCSRAGYHSTNTSQKDKWRNMKWGGKWF